MAQLWQSGGSGYPVARECQLLLPEFHPLGPARPCALFYFEAFDESWKAQDEGPQGACWGVWEKHGVLKPGMQDVFDGERTIELTYVPPLGSFDDLQGRVWQVQPADYRVAVYIQVRGGWWTKPSFEAPLTDIRFNGGWTCDITSGGADQEATMMAAYLVPNGYTPPLISGGSTLPAELDENAVATTRVNRIGLETFVMGFYGYVLDRPRAHLKYRPG
jgi:hypothetical protein